MINYDSLDGAQIEAVKHGEGPCVVAAPAGSGKTRCFVTRMARLIFEGGIAPSEVLGVTFTKAAAGEMKSRLEGMLPIAWHATLDVRTIHSLAWGIVNDGDADLKKQMDAQHFMLPSYGFRKIMESFISEFSRIYPMRNVKLSDFKSAFTLAKNYNVKPAGSAAFFSERNLNIQGATLEEAYRYYERNRLMYTEQSNNFRGRYDYDDLLVLASDMLRANPHLARRWGAKFKYVLVDEVQDTSPVQFEIIEALIKGSGHINLMLVGDLRQSIYGFRGAYPQYIQEFTDKHNARVINLRFNYRSKPEIVGVANKIARRMSDIDARFRDDMTAARG